jgi:cobaltochelatase CobN
LVTTDSECSALYRARAMLGGRGAEIRVLNLARSPLEPGSPPYKALFAEADLILGRWLGSRAAHAELLDAFSAVGRAGGPALIALSGEREPDPLVEATSTVPLETVRRAHDYFIAGGVANLAECLKQLLGLPASEPHPIPESGLYEPQGVAVPEAWGRVGVLFYRAQYAAGETAVVDALARALSHRGLAALCAYTYSLRDEAAAGGIPATIRSCFLDGRGPIDALLTLLSFAMAPVQDSTFHPKQESTNPFLEALDVPVVQAIVSSSFREEWAARTTGLEPRDVAMKVVMPELDGRIIGVPAGFAGRRELGGAELVEAMPDPERIERIAEIVERHVRLRRLPNREKRIAIILSNFPAKSSRIGNAVGLDTPESALVLLRTLHEAGYDTGSTLPESGEALIHALLRRLPPDPDEATNGQLQAAVGHVCREAVEAYAAGLAPPLAQCMASDWGAPPGSAFALPDGRLAMPGLRFGKVCVGVQPARGYGENPVAIYHDPDLPPTYHYLAFYRWLRDDFRADALVHLGKHGNLEWLPGKGLALSRECFPDAVLEGLPLFYPFIINDPGEGTQAKRRSHAVIIDHLIPPMMRAETYDELMRLEQLTDDFYRYRALDPVKLPAIEDTIWDLVCKTRLDEDLRLITRPTDFDALLQSIDGYLCEIGDAQIRDGLHILGKVPQGKQLVNLLSVMLRLPNGPAPSLHAELARALGHRMRVVLIQFIKGQWTPGEIKAARRLCPELEVHALGDGFTWVTKNPEQDRATTQQIWQLAAEKIRSGHYDIVILDEANVAMKHGYLEPVQVIEVLKQRGPLVHVVLTGRGAPPEIIDFADLVSEIRAVKHPFKQGVRGQKEVEF